MLITNLWCFLFTVVVSVIRYMTHKKMGGSRLHLCVRLPGSRGGNIPTARTSGVLTLATAETLISTQNNLRPGLQAMGRSVLFHRPPQYPPHLYKTCSAV
ncbi:hypothetical protein F5B21DRAFT_366660 [Xylaria acuta]|nr:hypothetical protein F5B21DRAFT_366660 [Xylaria acuta]